MRAAGSKRYIVTVSSSIAAMIFICGGRGAHSTMIPTTELGKHKINEQLTIKTLYPFSSFDSLPTDIKHARISSDIHTQSMVIVFMNWLHVGGLTTCEWTGYMWVDWLHVSGLATCVI